MRAHRTMWHLTLLCVHSVQHSDQHTPGVGHVLAETVKCCLLPWLLFSGGGGGGSLPLTTVPPSTPPSFLAQWSIDWTLIPTLYNNPVSAPLNTLVLPPPPLGAHASLLSPGTPVIHYLPTTLSDPLPAPAHSLRFGGVSTPDLHLPPAAQRLSSPCQASGSCPLSQSTSSPSFLSLSACSNTLD